MRLSVAIIKNSLGFTFIELLIALLILGLLSSVGLDQWSILKQRNALASATLSLFAFIQQAQSEANWQNRNVTIFLFEQDNAWCLSVDYQETRPDSCFKGNRYFFSPASTVRLSHFNDTAMLTFYGKRANAQPGTLILENSQGRTHIIISGRGRLRYCSETRGISGIPIC
ncbi:GspH/FimT family pseudopilin [Utexia brackfieldae]|uniref:GspH/FimT family pseudopilin n=1 Tax=Utexia brackfieldae TaxID=3074108 RepID=UPI00370DB26D